MEKSKEIKTQIEEQTKEAIDLDLQRNNKIKLIGNILSDKVPVAKGEENNVVDRVWGVKPDIEVEGKTLGKLHHHEVLNLLDFAELERGQKVAGHRGYYLKGQGLMLCQALSQFALQSLYK